MIPVLETWSVRADIPVSHLLMPMVTSVIVGGLVTIIGTSTSLVVQGLAGSTSLGFFEIGALGAPFSVITIVFLIIVGPYLLPKTGAAKVRAKQWYAWHRVPPKSPLIGTALMRSTLVKVPGAEVLWCKPAEEARAHFVPDCKGELNLRDNFLDILSRPVAVDDLICFVGVAACIEDIPGLEICWLSGSQLHGFSFFEMHLSDAYPNVPLKVRKFNTEFRCRVRRIIRNGEVLHLGSGSIRDGSAKIEAGDRLILEGGFSVLHLRRDPRVRHVEELDYTAGKVQSSVPLARQLHPFIAVLTLLAIVVLNATAVFTIYEAAAMGIILLLITDTMNWKDIVNAIPGNLMLMICYAFALAAAMNKSGLGAIIGDSFAKAFVGHTYVQLLGIYLCATIVTAIAPNSAAATIVFPIVTNMAKAGGFNVLAGIYCLMIAASADFMTPFGYQVNLMIQQPGSYMFVDYIKLGVPVTLIGLFICPLIAMYVWPLVPDCVAGVGVNCTNMTIANLTNATA